MKPELLQRKRKRPKHGRLIKWYLENASSDLLELTRDSFQSRFKNESGIYALYKDSDLYYIGLTKSLAARLAGHMKDHHSGKWNRFSLYMLHQKRHLKPVESLLLTLTRPKGNLYRSTLPKETSLKPFFKNELAKLQQAVSKAI